MLFSKLCDWKFDFSTFGHSHCEFHNAHRTSNSDPSGLLEDGFGDFEAFRPHFVFDRIVMTHFSRAICTTDSVQAFVLQSVRFFWEWWSQIPPTQTKPNLQMLRDLGGRISKFTEIEIGRAGASFHHSLNFSVLSVYRSKAKRSATWLKWHRAHWTAQFGGHPICSLCSSHRSLQEPLSLGPMSCSSHRY